MASVRPRLCTHGLWPNWIAIETAGDLTTRISAGACNRIAVRYARYVIDVRSPITPRGAPALGQRRDVTGYGAIGCGAQSPR